MFQRGFTRIAILCLEFVSHVCTNYWVINGDDLVTVIWKENLNK